MNNNDPYLKAVALYQVRSFIKLSALAAILIRRYVLPVLSLPCLLDYEDLLVNNMVGQKNRCNEAYENGVTCVSKLLRCINRTTHA